MLQEVFGVTVTTKNTSITTSQFRLVVANGLSKKHEAITVCSVIRLPNNRFWSKAFHINKKITHLSTSPGCISISHVFFHVTTWIFWPYRIPSYGVSSLSLDLLPCLSWAFPPEKCDPSTALSHQCRLSSGFPPRHTTVCWEEESSGSFFPIRFGVQRSPALIAPGQQQEEQDLELLRG